MRHIEIITNVSKECAKQAYDEYVTRNHEREKKENVITIITGATIFAWLVFCSTHMAYNLLPDSILDPLTILLISIGAIIILLTNAQDVTATIAPAPYLYYEALDRGKIVKIEAWQIERNSNMFDMRLIQSNEKDEMFHTIIPQFHKMTKNNINNPIFDLDKRILYIPYEDNKMLIVNQ